MNDILGRRHNIVRINLSTHRITALLAFIGILTAAAIVLFPASTPGASAQADRPPDRPTGLQVTTEHGSLGVSVDWDDVPGATSYSVRWRVAGPGNPLNEGVQVQSSSADIAVADYGEWVVRIEACNNAGCGLGAAKRFRVEATSEPTSTPTPEPTFTPTPTPVPTATPIPDPTATPTPTATSEPVISVPARPSGLAVETQSGSLDVSVDWNDVPGTASYYVRWRVAGPGNPLSTPVQVQSSDADITVADYGDWVVRVEACNSLGCGQGSAKRFQVIPAPTPTPEPQQQRQDSQGLASTSTPEATPTPNTVAPDLTIDNIAQIAISTSSMTWTETVRNQGDGRSGTTTLRFYRSADSSITASDTLEDEVSVVGLGPGESVVVEVTAILPTTYGTYYYGSCVDAVANESDTTNNCTKGGEVTFSLQTTSELTPTVTSTPQALTLAPAPPNFTARGKASAPDTIMLIWLDGVSSKWRLTYQVVGSGESTSIEFDSPPSYPPQSEREPQKF